MSLRPRLIFSTSLLITADAALFHVLTALFASGPIVGRLLSLGIGLVLITVISRLRRSAAYQAPPPGLRPLFGVSILLSFGLFALLAFRAPQVQPLLHLLISWFAALLFELLGLMRLRRLRD